MDTPTPLTPDNQQPQASQPITPSNPQPVAPTPAAAPVPPAAAPAPAGAHAENRTLMGVLCYLGILVLIPLLTQAKHDPFVRFHIQQGLVLLVASVALSILSPVLFFFIIALPIAGLFLFILAIMGIVHVVKGRMVPLPLIGQFGKQFNI